MDETTSIKNKILKKLNVQILSWNVNTNSKFKLKELHLSNLLKIPNLEREKCFPQIIAIGFQELVDQLKAISLPPEETYFGTNNILNLLKKKTSNLLLTWVNEILSALAELHSVRYAPLFASRLVAIGMCIFVRCDANGCNGYIAYDEVLNDGLDDGTEINTDSCQFRILNCKFGNVGVGLGGFYGNKGALAFSLEIECFTNALTPTPNFISVCFLVAHLQAHEGEHFFLSRNEDLQQVFDCLVLSPLSSSFENNCCLIFKNPVKFLNNFVYPYNKNNLVFYEMDTENLYNNDFLFLFGDLNYRLKKTLTLGRTEILKHMEEKKIENILEMDELNLILNNFLKNNDGVEENVKFPSCFMNFKEQKITFLPTFKLNVNKVAKEKDAVEARKKPLDLNDSVDCKHTYSDKRLPAYTDRILFKVNSYKNNSNLLTSHILCKYYSSIPKFHGFTDHHPISGFFELEVTFKDVGAAERDGLLVNKLDRVSRVQISNRIALSVKNLSLSRERINVDMALVKKLRWERVFRFAIIPFSVLAVLGSAMCLYYYIFL